MKKNFILRNILGFPKIVLPEKFKNDKGDELEIAENIFKNKTNKINFNINIFLLIFSFFISIFLIVFSFTVFFTFEKDDRLLYLIVVCAPLILFIEVILFKPSVSDDFLIRRIYYFQNKYFSSKVKYLYNQDIKHFKMNKAKEDKLYAYSDKIDMIPQNFEIKNTNINKKLYNFYGYYFLIIHIFLQIIAYLIVGTFLLISAF